MNIPSIPEILALFQATPASQWCAWIRVNFNGQRCALGRIDALEPETEKDGWGSLGDRFCKHWAINPVAFADANNGGDWRTRESADASGEACKSRAIAFLEGELQRLGLSDAPTS